MTNALDLVVQRLNQKYKKEVIQIGTSRLYVEKIPFSSPRLNYMTYGGVPIGKGTELLGEEGSGKTTAALDITAQAQKKAKREFNQQLGALRSELEKLEEKNNKSDQKKIEKLREELAELEERGPRRCVYIDIENTLDEDWAEKIGVDTDELYLMRPDETAEEVLQSVLDLIESGMIICLVIDSLPMLISQKLFDETLDKKAYGGISDVVTAFVGKVTPLLTRHKTALVIVNQTREDFNNAHNIYKTPGGRALKFFFSLRLYFRKGSFINKDYEEVPLSPSKTTEPFGHMVDVHIVKTKVCKPDRRIGQFTIQYDESIDSYNDTAYMAEKYGFVTKNGSWYTLMEGDTGALLTDANGDGIKVQGWKNLLKLLKDDEVIFEELSEAVNAKLAEVA